MISKCSKFDPLSVIHESRYRDVLSELKEYMPDSIHPHNFLRCAMHWKCTITNLKLEVLAPGSDFSDGTVVIKLSRYGGHLITAFCSHDRSLRRLKNACKKTENILWDSNIVITCLPERLAEMFEEILKEKRTKPYRKTQEQIFWMPRVSALVNEPRIPEGHSVELLNEKHVYFINDSWQFKEEGSHFLIGDQIEAGLGLGLFEGEELVSWAMLTFYGGLGMVQTVVPKRRLGMARAVVQEIIRVMASHGFDIHCGVNKANEPATKFFTKLRFKKLYNAVWFQAWTPDPLDSGCKT